VGACIRWAHLQNSGRVWIRAPPRDLTNAVVAGIEASLSPSERGAVRQKMLDAGLSICCVATGVRMADPDREARAQHVADLRTYIDLAADLGCGLVRTFGGPQAGRRGDLRPAIGACAVHRAQSGEVGGALARPLTPGPASAIAWVNGMCLLQTTAWTAISRCSSRPRRGASQSCSRRTTTGAARLRCVRWSPEGRTPASECSGTSCTHSGS
jgi:hypothetical protein